MGRRKFEDTQVLEVRKKMTEAAVELFHRSGLEAVTFRGLGQALGISHVTPYRYFASKDDLIASVCTVVFKNLDHRLRSGDRTAKPARARLAAIWQRLLSYGNERPDDYRLLFGLSLPMDNDSLPLRAARTRTLEFICGIYQQGVHAGELHGDPVVSVQLMFAAAHGLISLHLAGQLAEATLGVEQLLESMMLALLAAGPRAEGSDAPPPKRGRRRSISPNA